MFNLVTARLCPRVTECVSRGRAAYRGLTSAMRMVTDGVTASTGLPRPSLRLEPTLPRPSRTPRPALFVLGYICPTVVPLHRLARSADLCAAE